MMECSLRLRGLINADESTLVCPDSYNPDTRELFKPIGSSLVGISITLVILLIAVFTANVYMYRQTAADLSKSLDQIRDSHLVAPAGSPSTNASVATPSGNTPGREG
jgi:hypothetical protein